MNSPGPGPRAGDRDPLAAGVLREGIVLGFVHGTLFGQSRGEGERLPGDAAIVGAVFGSLRMDANRDTFPHLTALFAELGPDLGISARTGVDAAVLMEWLAAKLGDGVPDYPAEEDPR